MLNPHVTEKAGTVQICLRLDRPYFDWLKRKSGATKISPKKIVQRGLNVIAKDDLTDGTRELSELSPVEIALKKNRV